MVAAGLASAPAADAQLSSRADPSQTCEQLVCANIIQHPIAQIGRNASSLAVSANGETIVVGEASTEVVGPASSDTNGVVYVLTATASTGPWSVAAMLTPPASAVSAMPAGQVMDFGASVAVSSNGQSILVGAPNATASGVAGAGAAFLYSDASGSWQLTSTLAPTSAMGAGSFGNAVALSGDGTTAAVGAPEAGPSTASSYPPGMVGIYTAAVSWDNVATISGPTINGNWYPQFGATVALNSAGTELVTDVLASPAANTMDVFDSSSGAWSGPPTSTISGLSCPTNSLGECASPPPLALSGDGNTFVVGGGACGSGGPYVYTQSTTGWSQAANFDDTACETDLVAMASSGGVVTWGSFDVNLASSRSTSATIVPDTTSGFSDVSASPVIVSLALNSNGDVAVAATTTGLFAFTPAVAVTVTGGCATPEDLEKWQAAGVDRLIVSPWRSSREVIEALRRFRERFAGIMVRGT
jgi:hypothetical protein